MDLSVVIPSHLRFKPLLELLESLSQQDLPKEQYEVLVISNLEDPFYKRKTTVVFKYQSFHLSSDPLIRIKKIIIINNFKNSIWRNTFQANIILAT